MVRILTQQSFLEQAHKNQQDINNFIKNDEVPMGLKETGFDYLDISRKTKYVLFFKVLFTSNLFT